jgi:hypothetical protein
MSIRMIAQATVPDGYFGATMSIGIAIIGTRIVGVARFGYYGLGLPEAASIDEALWLLNNHPTARGIKLHD